MRAPTASNADPTGISRRVFLGGLAGFLLAPWVPASRARGAQAALPASAIRALESSPFVYVSPLRSDGSESTCHGEVWFGWLDGGVVLITRDSTWKAQSVVRGLDRARIWAGDHGRWKKGLGGRNERFREGPSFDAGARRVQDRALLDRLLAIFDQKYPDEIRKWRPRMEKGYADGSRVLLRYEPDGARAGNVTPPAGESP